MNYIIILSIIFLSFFNVSCKEQDYFKINTKPHILIENIGPNYINFKIVPDNSNDLMQLLISKNDKFDNNTDTLSNLVYNDTINYSMIKFNNNQGLVFNSKFNKSKNVYISNLENLTDYYFALYKREKGKLILHQKIKFSTVVEAPSVHSKNITFSNVTDTEMTISFQSGNGEGRIVLMRKDSAPELPTDGIEYKFSQKYKNDSAILKNNTYCIYKTKISADNKIVVSNLEKGKYYFAVIEFNGNGKHINYLGEFNGNIRTKSTSLEAPVALPAEIVDLNNFVAKWEKHPDAEYFMLDIAEDEQFVNIVQPYENVDVGDSNIVEIELPFSLENKKLYYRVRAFVNGTITNSSNIIKVEKVEKVEKGGK